VVFILSDDHRYDFMGCMGKPPFLRTPNMDRMVSDGAHIRNAFVSTSLCSPSRASVLTGQYAHHHGVVDNQRLVPEGTVFFPSLLQEAGYETAFIGKWHMGGQTDAPRPGFDHWVSFRGQGPYFDPVLNINGEQQQVEGYMTDLLTEHALDWLADDRDRPFFLYLSHKAVHGMFDPAPRHKGVYADEDVPRPASMANTEENYTGKPAWVREQRNSWHGVDYMYYGKVDYDSLVRTYCECLLGLDESIGRVLSFLEDNGLAEDTLVVYMGDNGFLWGEHGLIDKRCMYEESIRVPMMAYCPGYIEAGRPVDAMVQNIDIGPTVLDLAGATVPESMDGISFRPLLEGASVEWRDAILYEYYWERNFPQTPTVHGIRTDRYKYMHYHGVWDADELYDLEADPNEMNNLIDDEAHLDTLNELKGRMFDMLEATDGMSIPLRRDRGGVAGDRNPELEAGE